MNILNLEFIKDFITNNLYTKRDDTCKEYVEHTPL